jgi:hypothetical protein
MSNPNNVGEKRGDGGGKGGGNRRRYFRRRKPAAPKAQPESAPKPPPRKAAEPPPKGRTRNNARNEGGNAGKNDRDRRGGRRRRRRTRSERPEETPIVRESTLAAIDQEYKPPKSVFVYTYVLRPGAPTSYEFRAEHFSRVGRRLEDFEIDLSPIFPIEGKAKPDPSPRLPMDLDEEGRGKFSDEIDEVGDFGDFDQVNGEEEGVEL